MKRLFKKYALYVGAVIGGALSYIGSLAIFAYCMNGNESSLFIAVVPAVVVACLIANKGGAENG